MKLPLAIQTPSSWARYAINDLPALLGDHAHLERKAAQNALELSLRWNEGAVNHIWLDVLNSVARDEVQHYRSVCRLMQSLGYRLERNHRNPYSAALRETIRRDKAREGLVDRLLVSALIELRSCERFFLLAESMPRKRLAKFYRSLWLSEHGHYLCFLDLANSVLPDAKVQKRWQEYLFIEADIMQSQSAGARMHSWVNEE
jgi:tRNA-(ms[2]io[6]A)-hydroxylase